MEDKYIACMLLLALGDTIGFKNGDWEFNYGNNKSDIGISLDLVFEFIELGGVNNINLKNWLVSDDTLFNISIAKSLLEYSGNLNKDEEIKIKDNLIDTYNKILDDENNGKLRFMGNVTKNSIKKFEDNYDARNEKYNNKSITNGCAMRCIPIGLAFFGEDKLDQLIEFSIITSKFTHNSPIGYLGGFTSALFASFAIEKYPIQQWPFKLISLLESKKILKYINIDSNEEYSDYKSYLRYWNIYIETKFSDGKPIKSRSHRNLIFRERYYIENFISDNEKLGVTGFCANIMAYDCLLDSDGIWEKLIFYAMLNSGDTDTIGAIAGGLFGLLFGIDNIPKSMLKYLEFKNELETLAKQIYSKFYLNENIKTI